jgi:hypothetical protein
MIPKILIQTSKFPLSFDIVQKTKKNFKSWEYLFFDDLAVLNFFQDNPHPEFPNIVKKFREFKRGEHKADLFRYYFLYINGGLFLDSDVESVLDNYDVFENYDLVLTKGFEAYQGFFNGIIASKPKNSFIREQLEIVYCCPHEILEYDYHFFCKALNLTFEKLNNKGNTLVLSEHKISLFNSDASKIIQSDSKVLFYHHWSLGYVPDNNMEIIKPEKRVESKSIFIRIFRKIGMLCKFFNYKVEATNIIEKFTGIYNENKWEFGNGSGSTIENTLEYNSFIKNFIIKYQITTVTDLGCGDWQSSHLIYNNIPLVDYLGVDAVENVINHNKTNYPFFDFSMAELSTELEQIRDSELYIIKDVLQHLPTNVIYTILDKLILKDYKYILIINYANQLDDNEDLPDINDFTKSRGLSVLKYPLKKYGGLKLADIYCGETKEIGLLFKRTNWNNYKATDKMFFNKNILQIHELPKKYNFIRVGGANDGGYVVVEGLQYDLFLSCGIADDTSFEVEILSRCWVGSCTAFDGTISNNPITQTNLTIINKNIYGYPMNDNETNLSDYIGDKKNVLLKMDIEGSEFDWINAFPDLSMFAQIIIEIHWPFDRYRMKVLQKLQEAHGIVHFHENNYSRNTIASDLPCDRTDNGYVLFTDSYGQEYWFPEVFELTLVRKDLLSGKIINKLFPTELDRPCTPMGASYNIEL